VFRECFGYGPGKVFSKEELDKYDQHKLEAEGTGAAAEKAQQQLAPAKRFGADEQHEIRAKKTRKKSAASTVADARRSANEAAIAA
jgi:hypothetical protein